MLLITCGVLMAFIDHAGVYILKLCPRFSLDLQDKLKPAVADGSLLMPLCEDNVPTPAKQASIGNL